MGEYFSSQKIQDIWVVEDIKVRFSGGVGAFGRRPETSDFKVSFGIARDFIKKSWVFGYGDMDGESTRFVKVKAIFDKVRTKGRVFKAGFIASKDKFFDRLIVSVVGA